MPAIRFAIAAVAAAISLIASVAPAFAAPDSLKGPVNVFTRPDASSRSLGTLAAGDLVNVAGCDGNWCQISGNGLVGWVNKGSIAFKGMLPPPWIGNNGDQPPRPGNNGGNSNNDGGGFNFDFNFGNDNPGPFPPDRDYDPRPPRPQHQQAQACFYSGTNFRGDSFCVLAGDTYEYLPSEWDNQIRSVEITGRARVDLCRDEDLEGACATLRSSQSRLPHQVDRRASSLQVY